MQKDNREEFDFVFKVALVGESGAGKFSVIKNDELPRISLNKVTQAN